MADDIYRPQLNPATAVPFAGGDPDAFGAAGARGMIAAGESIDSAIHAVKQNRRQDEAAAAGVEMADISAELERAAVDARADAAPGGEGHTERVEKLADERIGAALGRIADKRTRDAFTQRYEEIRGRITGNEYAWEAGERVALRAENIDRQGTILANGLAANPTAQALDDGLAQVETTINELDGVSANGKAKAIRGQQRKLAAAWGNAMQDKDPHTLLGVLDKGLLNPYLEPEDINALRAGAHVEIRRADALARQQKNDAEQALREEISIFRKGIALGNQPDDKDTNALIARAEAAGLKEQAADLTGDRVKLGINRETRTWSPIQYRTEINRLEALGDKRGTEEDIRLAQLKAIAGPRIQQANSDPHAAAALAGQPAPPLAAGVPARVAWAQGIAKSQGLVDVPYLSNEEMQPYKDRVAQGTVGTLEVAREIRGQWGVNVGQQILRQVAPGNSDAQLFVGLPPVTAEVVGNGVKALADNPKLAPNDLANRVFAEFRGAIPDELEASMFRAAKQFTARWAASRGVTDWADDEEGFTNAFRHGIQRVGGMLTANGKDTGGFIRFNGRYAVLPQDMGRDDFLRRMSRAQVDPQRFVAAAGGSAPHYRAADGKLKPMTAEQMRFLGKYTLKTVAPGLYTLVGPQGGDVVAGDGKPWLLDVRKLP